MTARIALALFAAVALPATADHYVIAFNQPSGLPNNVDKMVADAGGTIVERLPEIGGVGVESSNPNFLAAIAANSSVKAADRATEISLAPTLSQADLGISPTNNGSNNNSNASPTGSDAQPMPDSLGFEQWDKKKLNATLTGSYAVQRGRKDVRVFVIDTGADVTHIDVAANLDVAQSRSFVPTEPTIQDFNGHGTWTISAVGAPINGVGISGVAPNVTLVEGKVLNGAGRGLFIFTDQALVYAGLQHFDVVSASLGGFIPKCGAVNNPNQSCDHPDYILLNRATQFARQNGVLPVAALGNDGLDVSDGRVFGNFVEAPGEIAGWVGVAATGYPDDKAFYSNYGTGKTDVSAPGGNTRNYTGVPGSAVCPHASICRLIGAWSSTGSSAPADPREECTGPGGTPPCFLYGYVQGTSMATPNVAGVAALIISQFGDFTPNNQNKPHMSPTAVEAILQQTANNQPCPTPNTVVQGPGEALLTATCQGNTGYNNFFGKGIVDALKAITP
jgi:lantibiotic leader peptide-processing serine protease